MSSKKRRRKEKAEAAASGEAPAPAKASGTHHKPAPAVTAPPPDPEEEMRASRTISVVGFAIVGLLMGFLTGSNHQVDTALSASPLVQATWVSGALATQSADWITGLMDGIMGALVGGSFGYSLFLSPGVMFLSWVAGVVGLAAGLTTGLTLVGGVGWMGGFFAVLFGALKMRLDSGT